MRVRAVEVLIIHRSSQRVLGLLRNNEPKVWSVVTGGVEDVETFLNAAKREVFEETRLDADKIIDTGLSYKFTSSSGQNVEIHDFALKTDITQITLNSEHAAFEWLDFDALLARIPFEDQKRGLSKIMEVIRE